ncbi:MAG: NAD(P)H-hydrate dehydratase [Lentisphaerae bacterium]|nr:NAD(P)H-hydrate dehydratase [Lentisphaerota bacterium]
MKIITSDEMRTLDKLAIEEHEISGEVLMERAGTGLANAIINMRPPRDKKILLIAGHGNNGGDAFVAARILVEEGYTCSLILACEESEIKGDAFTHFVKMRQDAGIIPIELTDVARWEKRKILCDVGLIVDGLIGTGLKGVPQGVVAAAIRYINKHLNCCKIVAIDVPSGLNADTGEAEGDCVFADRTVTMALPKIGLIQPRAIEYTGSITVVNIGFPQELIDKYKSDYELVTKEEVQRHFPRRARMSHKGNYGHLLVIAGSRGMAGAAGMALSAALRSGVGLLSAAVPESIAQTVTAWTKEAMVYPCPETENGAHTLELLDKLKNHINRYDAVLIGPGMGSEQETKSLIKVLLDTLTCPVLLDADGLNAYADSATELAKVKSGDLVLTPHPAELARILGVPTQEVQANRFSYARKSAQTTDSTVLLKGAGTLIAHEGNRLRINMSGNPGMATGGSGDVLAGLIAGFMAQGISGFDAAQVASFIHGCAGDFASFIDGEVSMTATDIIDAIPWVFLEMLPR